MNQPLVGLPVAISLAPGTSRNDIIESIAQKIERLPMRGLGGIEAIEGLHFNELGQHDIAGTVFAVISQELADRGIEQDGTLGSVMEGLGFDRKDEDTLSNAAHELGCYCHGEFISPQIAADRLRNLKT